MKHLSLALAGVHGYNSTVRLPPDHGTDIKTKLDAEIRALHVAAMNGNEDMVQSLLNGEANIMARDNYGRSILHNATIFGQEGVVKLLLVNDSIMPDSKDNYGRTPLSFAAGGGQEVIVALLQAHDNVDINSKDNDGRTPLSFAAGGGHKAIVERLLARREVKADSKDDNDRTPLSWAAMGGYQSIVKLLLARNDVEADSNDKNFRTPLSWAAHGVWHRSVSGETHYLSGQRRKIEEKWTDRKSVV